MRSLIVAAVVLLAVGSTEARERRLLDRLRPNPGCPGGVCKQNPTMPPVTDSWPAGVPKPMPSSLPTSTPKPAVQAATTPSPAVEPGDGLDEVNAKRAARGLRPFIRDDSLTLGARACAAFRAARHLFGHTQNDFAFLPSGITARSAGCAAYHASYGWMSCCVYENFTYAGAAWVTGSDGKRYMHLFVR